MSSNRDDYDVVSVVFGIVVFGLPLTLLVPEFSVWEVVPKFHVIRFHIFDQYLTWYQLNAALITLLITFFCFYLELRKRELDEMVESVLTVNQVTDTAMKIERVRQAAEVRACVQLLDASTDHYETLIMLRDDLRKREKHNIQHPPVIELSSSEI